MVPRAASETALPSVLQGSMQGLTGPMEPRNHYDGEPAPEREVVSAVLSAAVEALDQARIPFVVMGGLVVATFARPRMTDDIDLFVQPEHARDSLVALRVAGFDTEETDPMWLYKGWRDGVLVDVIFRSAGDVYLDEEMLARAARRDCRGTRAPLISAEDLLVIKAVAATERGSHHWYDALGIIARTPLDWVYVVERARQAGPRRVLSLLLYAESNDMAVPSDVVEGLFAIVHPPAGGS
jgi:predicted nucleotidyltransferase